MSLLSLDQRQYRDLGLVIYCSRFDIKVTCIDGIRTLLIIPGIDCHPLDEGGMISKRNNCTMQFGVHQMALSTSMKARGQIV